MTFQPGNPYGGKHGGDQGGAKPLSPAIKRARLRFYTLMHKKMLPLAAGFLLECLRSQRKDDKKWATTLVAKKSIPDAVTLLGLPGDEGANTLAGLIQQAAQAKLDNDMGSEEVNEAKDIGKDPEIPSLVKRPGASKAAKETWKRRKKDGSGKKNS